MAARQWGLFVGITSIFACVRTSLCLSMDARENAKVDSLRIAVVGGGIGGSLVSHFIDELLQTRVENLEIHVFDVNKTPGGRAAVIELEPGLKVEYGASIIHSKNQHLVNLSKKFGLEESGSAYGSKTFAIFDGKDFLLQSSEYKIITMWRLLTRYGFSLFYMESFTKQLLKDFLQIYSLQSQNHSFTNPEDLLRAINCWDSTQSLLSSAIPSPLLEELATGAMRMNYNQNGATVNAFAGGVSLAAESDELWSVKGGNFQIAAHALDKKNSPHVEWHPNTKVTEIRAVDKGAAHYMISTHEEREATQKPFDIVVIATPLEESKGIKLEPTWFANSIQSKLEKGGNRKFQTVHVTFVKGNLNPVYFGLGASTPLKDLPGIVLTTENPDVPFSSIGQINLEDNFGVPWYKVFSRSYLSEESVGKIFTNTVQIKRINTAWKAYPVFNPPEVFAPFVLDKGFYYLNSIENAASALEISAVSAKNIALLVANQIIGLGQVDKENAGKVEL